MPLMETWDVRKTATWLSEIGLDAKYGDICREEDINGRALLLLACKTPDELVSVFQLKKGPHKKLMNNLQTHLKAFEQGKSRTAYCCEWTVQKLCNWLRELGVPEIYVAEALKEEIDGQALLLFKESGDLRECLQLKVGPWIVLEHELSLHVEGGAGSTTETSTDALLAETNQVVLTGDDSICERKKMHESKEPLASYDPSTNSVLETPAKVVLSKEDEKLLLLQNAIQLNIGPSTGAEDVKECLIRSIFVKRGKGANALETLFNFVVITKDEMTDDKRKKLWSVIREKTKDWMELLPVEVSRSFVWDRESESFSHVPSGETLAIHDGKVGQIFLEKLSDDEYRRSLFIVLVDKQLLEETKPVQYRFHCDKKGKTSFLFKLNARDSKYHASFDTNSPSQGLKLSKYFRSLMSNAGESIEEAVLHPSPNELKPPSTYDDPCYQTPRPFSSEFVGKSYNEGFILNCWETGSKDLMKPAREFKLLRGGGSCSEDDLIKKFVYETLRFACGCLNERTNGTIHFGVADEVEDQTCGYQPREVVGSCVAGKPRYTEKLTEFIDKCFVGDSRSNVHNCIRPPVFIPVKCNAVEQHSDAKVVLEVDIEPSYSLCAEETFKVDFKCLGRGKEKAAAYIRRGSKTQAITEPQEMDDYRNRRPKLDKERKKREQERRDMYLGMEKQDSVKLLYDKLKRLLCANKKVLDSSMYPILVLSKPDDSMNQGFLNETFGFIQNVKWQVVIDFDNQGSDSNGLCSIFISGPNTPQCNIHEAEDYDGDDSLIEGMGIETNWIFGNGYAKLGREAVGFKQWNNSERKRGLSLVIQSLAKKIPDARAVVLFLLLSQDYEPMADTFKDFCTYLDGPNQLVYVAENAEVAQDWEAKLCNTCLEEHELRERGVVGMSWREFQGCVKQMVYGIDRHQRYVTMATGSPCPLNVSFNNIEIVSALECEELRNLTSTDRLDLSSKVERDFYKGDPVTWTNFWFTDAQKNHVLRRDNYSDLETSIKNVHSRGSEGKVQTITIYHHIGAGASTMSRQALWDFRYNRQYPYRCAVVTKIDDSTSKELMLLRKVGYGDESDVSIPPVLALVENVDDLLFRELRLKTVELATKFPRTEWPVCVFVYCKSTQKPRDCYLKEKATSVFLEQQLSTKEVDWFKDKYTEMEGQFQNEDPERNFETYANENLISFMIMKENFNPRYASSIVERNLCQVREDELTLLEYTSLLNIYNPYPVFSSSFDTIMLSASYFGKRKYFRDWVEDLTHSARIFLREVDVSSHLGTGKAIAIVHPVIASELLDQIAEKKGTSVSQIAVDFLKSPLLGNQTKCFTSTYLHDGANRMLKHRKKYEYGDDVQTTFSPLLEKILYIKVDADGKKRATEQSIEQAAEVLREGLDKFKDPMLAQQMARVFYLNATSFSESKIDSCFEKAFRFCNIAIEMNPNNSFLFDTMGRIHQKKMKVLFDPIRKENRQVEIDAVTPTLPLAFDAMKWFRRSLAASMDIQNNYGYHGELSAMFYLLDILRCARLFRGQEGLKRLQGYLAFCQEIPPEVQTPWEEFHEAIKDLRNRFSHCMEGITEAFAVYKGVTVEEKMLPKEIASFKAQYHSYFCDEEVSWNTENPEECWEYRWHQINQHLAGGIFSSVFLISRTEENPRETLLRLNKLADENYREPVDRNRYNDLLLIITTCMALHSPFGKRSRHKTDPLVKEYQRIYSFVEKLCSLEEYDGGCQRLYAHLFKVMFLWPRKDLELSSYRAQDFYDSLRKLRDRWERKCKGHFDPDKMLKQKMYKNMSFKEQTKQYTTLFYLGNGSGLDVFVHINELSGKGSVDWENPKTKERLKRLTGVVEGKNSIRVQNPLEQSKTIELYYSPFRQGGFSKEEVSFYLGFSWPQPIAFDVKYTRERHGNPDLEFRDPVFDDQVKFALPKYPVVTYKEYTSKMGKLTKQLSKIDSLKEKKEKGQQLDENQEEKLKKEIEIKEKLEELKKSFDALPDLEEEIFD